MRRLVWGLLLALVAGGCTSVKMVQRDGCWVRRTEKVFGRVLEEVGPCQRPTPRWAEDRLTRLIQECVVQADWRWQARALEVWSRRLPYPTPRPREDELLGACMQEAQKAMAAETDLAALRTRVAEVSGERDALRADVAHDRTTLEESHRRIAEWLGQAAQKPPGNATASATSSSTSDGHASNESGATLAASASPEAPPPSSATASVVVPASPTPAAALAEAPAQEGKPREAPATKPKVKPVRARRPVQAVRADAPASCPPPAAGAAPCETGGAAEP